ncbi:MAG: LacI family DNA-binding transcriptional regulator [Chloroflexota bacterium]
MVYIKDVARAAGVSVATVSRVIAESGYPVRPETRERVLAAANRLGYRPNGLARGLRVGRSDAIGLCATTMGNPTVISAVEGIIHCSRTNRLHVQVTTTFWDPGEEASQLRLFLQERVAGVISFPSGAPAECYAELQQSGIPVVLLNRGVPGLAAPVVRYDFAGGYAGVVEALAGLGHRRIAALLPAGTPDRANHLRYWRAAFRRLGLQAPEALVAPARPDLARVDEAGTEPSPAYEAIANLLSVEPRPTALFASSVVMTLAALRAIHRLRLRVPEDISLVGTGDQRWETLFTPPIPSLCLDAYALGTQAARLLGRLIEDAAAVPPSLDAVVATRLADFDLLRGPATLASLAAAGESER